MAEPSSERAKIVVLVGSVPLMLILLLGVMLPLRNQLLVRWLLGAGASAAGIHVLPGKPTRFSTGDLVPIGPDLVTGFGACLVAFLVSLLIMAVVVALWRRLRRAHRS